MDDGFRVFLNLLSQPANARQLPPDETLHGGIAFYAHSLPLPHIPGFIRTVVASPSLWSTRSWSHTFGVQAALRQSLQLKLSEVERDTPSGWFFGPDLSSPLQSWVDAICEGIQPLETSLPALHASIAILSGLISGLDDVQPRLAMPRLRYRLEKHLCHLSGSALRLHRSLESNAWTNDFASKLGAPDETALTSCLLSRALAGVSSEHLYLVDVKQLSHLAQTTILEFYKDGHFLDGLVSHATIPGQAHQGLQAVQDAPVYPHLGALHTLVDRCLSLLSHKDQLSAWEAMTLFAGSLEKVCANASAIWAQSRFSTPQSSQDPLLPVAWDLLKTLLFCTLITAQSHVNLSSYHTAPHSPSIAPPAAVARSTLLSLYHLSFVSTKFGGIAADAGGLPQQKRAFFGSLDILASDPPACEELVSTLFQLTANSPPALRPSHSAFVLACAEQLVPCLSEASLEHSAVPFASQFLLSPLERETFESAHSLVLAIFANNGTRERLMSPVSDARDRFATRLAPFYLQSLLSNTHPSHLSSAQLTLAFSSLVRSLSSASENALAWTCIQAFVSRLDSSRSQESSSSQYPTLPLYPPSSESLAKEEEHIERALFACISALNLVLLPKFLDLLENDVLANAKRRGRVYESEIAEQVLGRVGDAQKDLAMSWWMGMRERERRETMGGREEDVRAVL